MCHYRDIITVVRYQSIFVLLEWDNILVVVEAVTTCDHNHDERQVSQKCDNDSIFGVFFKGQILLCLLSKTDIVIWFDTWLNFSKRFLTSCPTIYCVYLASMNLFSFSFLYHFILHLVKISKRRSLLMLHNSKNNLQPVLSTGFHLLKLHNIRLSFQYQYPSCRCVSEMVYFSFMRKIPNCCADVWFGHFQNLNKLFKERVRVISPKI